jgi:predicted nuclease of predicted toxin-antitoxin system
VRFFLDENVDAAVGAVLRDAGHDCWTAVEAGLSGAIDDAIAVYADDRRAVLLSHDKAFAERHRLNTLGRHVWLRCEPFEAPDAVGRHLPEITRWLASMSHVVVEVTTDRVTCHPPRWR